VGLRARGLDVEVDALAQARSLVRARWSVEARLEAPQDTVPSRRLEPCRERFEVLGGVAGRPAALPAALTVPTGAAGDGEEAVRALGLADRFEQARLVRDAHLRGQGSTDPRGPARAGLEPVEPPACACWTLNEVWDAPHVDREVGRNNGSRAVRRCPPAAHGALSSDAAYDDGPSD